MSESKNPHNLSCIRIRETRLLCLLFPHFSILMHMLIPPPQEASRAAITSQTHSLALQFFEVIIISSRKNPEKTDEEEYSYFLYIQLEGSHLG